MRSPTFLVAAFLPALFCASWCFGQQFQQLPDINSLKLLTTKYSDHAPDIPGNETQMDFYSGSGGTMVTVYLYRSRKIAFSTYSNSDVQNTYRMYVDFQGRGFFQEIAKGSAWQIPPWAR